MQLITELECGKFIGILSRNNKYNLLLCNCTWVNKITAGLRSIDYYVIKIDNNIYVAGHNVQG